MTSRDLVGRTLDFRSPARVPRQAWVLPWAEDNYPVEVERLRSRFPDDIVASPGLYRRQLPVVGAPHGTGTYIDEWGCRFDNVRGATIGLAREPLIADWGELERFRTPDCTLDVDRDAVAAFCRSSGKFVLAGTLVRPFERYCFLRTTGQALSDVLLQPPGFHELLGRIHAHYLREVEAWAATEVDAIYLMDDWGGQDRMLVAPALWRKHFKPLYRDYCEVAAHAGKRVFMHSDGHIADIVGDLIEIGVEALNSQVKCMGVGELGRAFRGRITFWGEIDQEELLPRSSLEDVRRAVAEMREHLYAEGGVIAQCVFGPGAAPENVLEVFRSWQAQA
jgi:hypothetical protein